MTYSLAWLCYICGTHRSQTWTKLCNHVHQLRWHLRTFAIQTFIGCTRWRQHLVTRKPSRREHEPSGEVQKVSLAAFSETTVRSQGKLWQRVQVQLLMRHGKPRLFLVQSCVVIRFAVRLLLSVTFSRLRGKGRARYSLVVWCRPSRRNLGNTSAGARGKYRTSRLNAFSQRHLDQAIVPRVHRASPAKRQKRLGQSSSERTRWILASSGRVWTMTETWERAR